MYSCCRTMFLFVSLASSSSQRFSVGKVCHFAFYPHFSILTKKKHHPTGLMNILCTVWFGCATCLYFTLISSWHSIRTISKHPMMTICHAVAVMHDSLVHLSADLLLDLPPVHKHSARSICNFLLCKANWSLLKQDLRQSVWFQSGFPTCDPKAGTVQTVCLPLIGVH